MPPAAGKKATSGKGKPAKGKAAKGNAAKGKVVKAKAGSSDRPAEEGADLQESSAAVRPKKKQKVGPLAGKLKELLPAALDLSSLAEAAPGGAAVVATAEEEDDDDDRPDEVENQHGLNIAPVEEPRPAPRRAAAEQEQAPAAKPRRKSKASAAEGEGAESSEATGPAAFVRGAAADGRQAPRSFFWEDEENQDLLAQIREQDAKRRKRISGPDRLEQDGIVVVREGSLDKVVGLGGAAVDFLQKELFENRKRTRSMKDRIDRNTPGVFRAGSHFVRR